MQFKKLRATAQVLFEHNAVQSVAFKEKRVVNITCCLRLHHQFVSMSWPTRGLNQLVRSAISKGMALRFYDGLIALN